MIETCGIILKMQIIMMELKNRVNFFDRIKKKIEEITDIEF